MLLRLPEIIAPQRLIKQGTCLEGYLPLARMQRLQVEPTNTQVLVHLQFGTDVQHIHYAKGQATTEIVLTCQRCLELMTLVLTAPIALALIEREAEEAQIPELYEPLLISDSLSLLTLIEDELILALPLAATHPLGTCQEPAPLNA